MGDEQRHQTAVKDFEHKIRQKRYFDLAHNVHDKAPIVQGDDVFIRDRGENATVIRAAPNAPRSYIVETPTNTYRRNTRHLNQMPRRSTRTTQPTQHYGEPIPWSTVQKWQNIYIIYMFSQHNFQVQFVQIP